MKKTLLTIYILICFTSSPSAYGGILNGPYNNLFDNLIDTAADSIIHHHDDEKKVEAFVDQIVKETLGEESERFDVVAGETSYKGSHSWKTLVPKGESTRNYTELLSCRVDQEEEVDSFFNMKNDLRISSKRTLARELAKRKKRLGDFDYEIIYISPLEIVTYAEAYAKKADGNQDAFCEISRVVQNGNWATEQIFIYEKAKLTEDKKKEWVDRMKESQSINTWTARCQAYNGGNE